MYGIANVKLQIRIRGINDAAMSSAPNKKYNLNQMTERDARRKFGVVVHNQSSVDHCHAITTCLEYNQVSVSA
jgi:hypothetical protein